jgi:gluconate 5-dehydrogenase
MPESVLKLFDLNGRTALVTGSSRGLGFVIARGLARAGATVVLNGRGEAGLESAQARLAGEGFVTHTAAFDATDEAGVDTAIERIEADIGPIEILVNNAGIQDRGALDTIETDRWREVIEVNLTAPFIVGRLCARRMISRGRGKIINICSVMSELGRRTVGPYTASKGGLKMLTRAMTVDWAGHGLQINAIGPGYFLTDMTRPLADDPEFDRWIRGRTPAGRWGDPEELVGAAVFFASDASSFVNGHILYVDGGMLSVL